jgi:hypothetical protein
VIVDRTRLEKATVEAVGFYDGVEEAMPDAFRVLVAAARAVVEAPEMWYCEKHKHLAVPGVHDRCGFVELQAWARGLPKQCRMVRVFLVPAEEEA